MGTDFWGLFFGTFQGPLSPQVLHSCVCEKNNTWKKKYNIIINPSFPHVRPSCVCVCVCVRVCLSSVQAHLLDPYNKIPSMSLFHTDRQTDRQTETLGMIISIS